MAAAMVALPAAAQETYENASSQAPTSTVLHATLEWAVPWRLSVPIFRLSARTRQVSDSIATAVAVSGGLVTQGSVPGYTNGDKTHASFDQGGFVYSMRGRNNSFLNLAFNYSKSRNFDFILGAAGRLNNASSNKLTYQKWRNGALRQRRRCLQPGRPSQRQLLQYEEGFGQLSRYRLYAVA